MSFAKNIGKSLSNKYSQKPLDSVKNSTADAIKTASRRTIQKTAEATRTLTGNKIADKITTVSKKASQNSLKTDVNEIEIPKNAYISPQKRQQFINENLCIYLLKNLLNIGQINHLNLEQENVLK